MIGVSAPALAEDADTLSTMKDVLLNTVTITGTRTPKTLDNTPVVTRVITADDIKKLDATNIKDVLLAEIPGVEFTYAMNQQVNMRMQGLGGMSVLFLIDGERLAGETLDNTDFQRLSMDNIERIEIVKGAASALYGSNSVGAVVNIITKSQSEPWAVQLNTRFGSENGEQRHGGMASFKQGRVTNILNVQYDTQDSYRVSDEDGKQTPVYGTRQWNLRDKMIFQLADGHQLIGRAGYYFHERNSSAEQKDRARDFSGGLRYQGQLSENDALDIGYTGDRYDKSDYYPATDKDYLDYKNMQHSLRALYTHTFSQEIALTLGGDAMMDYLKSYQFTEGDDHHDQYTADLFAQADWTPNQHWNFVAGVRADYFSHYGWELTPKLAAMYRTGNLKLRGSYSKGFRAPTLKEMYMDFNMANIFNIYGNQDLESEKTNSFSLSAEYVKQYYCFTLTGFYNILDNEITTLWDPTLEQGRGAMHYQNVEGTNLASADATLMARYPCGINAKLSYSYFHEFPRGDAKNTADSRPHTLTAQVDYQKTWRRYALNVVLNGRWLSKADYYTVSVDSPGIYNETTSPGYTMWRFTVLQKFWDCLTVTASVDNLFDYTPKQYQYNSPYTVGRTFTIGAALQLEKIKNIF